MAKLPKSGKARQNRAKQLRASAAKMDKLASIAFKRERAKKSKATKCGRKPRRKSAVSGS